MSVVNAFGGICLLFIAGATAYAAKADVVRATVECDKDRVCRFSVTVEHPDTGWQHYADRWDILSPDHTVLGTRILVHPHVGEQPFTRSLAGVKVPTGVRAVLIRARDSVHGYGGREVTVPLSGGSVE